MKPSLSSLRIPALVLAGAAFAAGPLQAQVFTYNHLDALLDFRPTAGGATDFAVDLGPLSQFTSGGSSFTITSFDSAQLLSAYGGSLNGLSWSVAGTVRSGDSTALGPVNTLFMSKASPDLNTASTPYLRASSSAQGATSAQIQSVANGLNNTLVGNSLSSTVKTMPDGGNQSYSTFVGSLGNWANTFGGGNVENATGASFTSAQRSDLYELMPQAGTPKGPGTLLGYFELSPTGSLTYTPVPEPATVASAAAFAGLAAVLVWRRRRTAQSV